MNKYITCKKDSKHTIYNIFGIKITIKNKYSKKDAVNYYKYCEDYINTKNNFIDINNEPYNKKNTVKPIAFYLPQYHSIPLNDKNFGKGFTEWVNVSQARPQFIGHYQPHIPIDVGFYNLSHDDVMYRQIELAKLYGIYGFCFHYYWFSGQRLLEKPIFNWLNNKELNLPFCLCWANENWSKLWDGGNKELIIEQKLKDNDDEKFFYDVLPFFKDERYIKVDNKPVLLIYRANLFEKDRFINFIKVLRTLAKKEGFDDLHLLGVNSFFFNECQEYGLDGIVEFPPHFNGNELEEFYSNYVNKNFNGRIYDFTSYINDEKFLNKTDENCYKGICCGWDNTARKARSGAHILLCNPELYKKWLSGIIRWTQKFHGKNDSFLFINAWNEWAEGTHLEPDIKYGYAYLQATKEALEQTVYE